MRLPVLAGLLALLTSTTQAEDTESSIGRWQRWEHSFQVAAETDPETELSVELTGPSGRKYQIDGFWDGGRTWRVRFMPDEIGTWKYRTGSKPAVQGLDGQQGEFQCVANSGDTILLKHGPVRISENGRYLAHADGSPFFWLADTSWNGALLSKKDDWLTYLKDRKEKSFTTIQFVTTQWRTAYTNLEGEVAYTGRDHIQINPTFFRRMDERVDAVNAQGLLAAPVVLWALGDPEYTPGKLPTDQAIRLAKYIVARYGANHVVWLLGGDENYSGQRAEHWKRIGRAVFGDRPHAPVTLHPQGMQWHFDTFADEAWLDLLIYQSGHGDHGPTLAWIHSGPPSKKWKEQPTRPVINSEPPYEDHIAYQSRQRHTAYNVRRAVYWSLLNAPTAGVTYGAHGVWSWQEKPGVPLNHDRTGEAKVWHEAMELPGSTHMKHVADLFTSVQWWRLRPDQSLLATQPGGDDPARFVAAARSEAGDLAVLYLPVGGQVELDAARLKDGLQAEWFNPRTGERTRAEGSQGRRFTAPDDQDWALVLHAAEEK